MNRKQERNFRLHRLFVLGQKHVGLEGIERPSLRDRLEYEMQRPMAKVGGDRELSHDSLFGDSHLQISMFGVRS